MNVEERIANLLSFEFESSAIYAATMIDRYGFAYVTLSPGDGTKYEISIISPPTNWQYNHFHQLCAMLPGETTPPTFQDRFSGSYFVATQLGPMYRWEGTEIGNWTYVHEKWTRGRAEVDKWTARVLFRFLNTLAPLLPAKPKRQEARID